VLDQMSYPSPKPSSSVVLKHFSDRHTPFFQKFLSSWRNADFTGKKR
jgi:hypothetical protein